MEGDNGRNEVVRDSRFALSRNKKKMQTIQYRRSRIWEIKEDKYTKSLAKNQVCAIFQMRDIRKNGLPKFIKLCMEIWPPNTATETSVFDFSY